MSAMRDSLAVMSLYKQYLQLTGDLINILESYMQRSNEEQSSTELKAKYKEFTEHAHKLILWLNEDLHMLIKLDYELKEIEEKLNGNH